MKFDKYKKFLNIMQILYIITMSALTLVTLLGAFNLCFVVNSVKMWWTILIVLILCIQIVIITIFYIIKKFKKIIEMSFEQNGMLLDKILKLSNNFNE